MNKLFVCTLLSAASIASVAEDAKPLTAEVELGVITTSGNTNTESYKGKVDVKHELSQWRNHYILEGLLSRDEVEIDDGTGTITEQDQTTAEKYFASAQADYKINKEHAAFFVYGEYNKNRFSGFDYQYTLALGYSNRLFTTDNSYLSYDVGPGMTVDKPEPIDGVSQDSEENFVVRFAAEYLYQISENAKFTQTVSSNYATSSGDNTKTKAVSALSAKINSSFAMRASFTVDYNTEVPEGTEHADTETALTIVYSF